MFEKLQFLIEKELRKLIALFKPSSQDDGFINFTDDKERKYLIHKREWLLNVLPNNISENWNNPDYLYDILCVAHAEYDLINEIKIAAKHLLKIDKRSHRSVTLYEAILVRLGKYQEAERLILNYLKTNPKTALMLNSLAKVQSLLGRHELALATLDEGLRMDPNEESGLQWWIAMQRDNLEKKGFTTEQALIRACEEANKKFGGWRAIFLLGRLFIEQKENAHAIKLFKEVLEKDWSSNPSILTDISGLLGNNENYQELIELIANHYVPEQHEIYTGLNLLKAYIRLNQPDEGLNLLRKLQNLDLTTKKKLQRYQQELEKLKE